MKHLLISAIIASSGCLFTSGGNVDDAGGEPGLSDAGSDSSTPAEDMTVADSGSVDASRDADGPDAGDGDAGRNDSPGDGVDSDGDGVDGTIDQLVFVRLGGLTANADGAGLTPDKPVRSVQGGVMIAESTGRRSILVALGEYSTDLDIRDYGLQIIGGYDENFVGLGGRSVLTRSNSVGLSPTVSVQNATVRLENLEISTTDADPDAFASTVTVFVNAANVHLSNCIVHGARAADGQPGQPGTNAVPASAGAMGTAGGGLNPVAGGPGAMSSCGAGGGGGGGSGSCPNTTPEAGRGGLPAVGGGVGGSRGSNTCVNGVLPTSGGRGGDGINGGGGEAIELAGGPGAMAEGQWNPPLSADGVPGEAGTGGGGGGGGGAVMSASGCSGSGGGAGGCGGLGGAAGEPGRASFAVLVFNSSLLVSGTTVILGRGGNGGLGGAGGCGANGGTGGGLVVGSVASGAGGSGGNGGDGGHGGGGQGGHGGSAFGIAGKMFDLMGEATYQGGDAGEGARGGAANVGCPGPSDRDADEGAAGSPGEVHNFFVFD